MDMSKPLPKCGYSVRECEILLGISEKGGHKLINDGKLKSFIGVDGRRKVSEMELYLYLRDRENITNK